jgi:(aminoalkyl)phosphonate N-acetyltransferase
MDIKKTEVRPALPFDFKIILSFINQLESTDFTEQELRRIYLNNLSTINNYYWVATNENEVVGFVSCHSQNLLHHGGLVGEVQELYVSHEYRGKSVGKLLLDKIKELALRDGFVQLEVATNVHRSLAQNFYAKEGFVQTHHKFVFKMDYLMNNSLVDLMQESR